MHQFRWLSKLATALSLGLCALPEAYAQTAQSPTLASIVSRGTLNCGVYPNFPWFETLDRDGNYVGFDVDFCKAVAAAANVQLKVVPLTATERFPALVSKSVDMLAMVTTRTASRDFGNGLQFAPVTFYDGQGFVTRSKNKIKSAKELSGATICVLQGTTSELNLADWFRANNLKLNAVTFASEDEVQRAYEANRCDAFTGGIAIIAGRRTNFRDPAEHIILPEVISKEPLAPVTAEGDEKWSKIVAWTIFATMIAEEKDVTAANVEQTAKDSPDPELRRLFGKSGSIARDMGMDPDWAMRAIKAAGNYREIFERNLGAKTPLRLERGLNAQWDKGGLIYAPPFR